MIFPGWSCSDKLVVQWSHCCNDLENPGGWCDATEIMRPKKTRLGRAKSKVVFDGIWSSATCNIWGFPYMGYPHSWMVYNAKAHLEVDHLGVRLWFRKHPLKKKHRAVLIQNFPKPHGQAKVSITAGQGSAASATRPAKLRKSRPGTSRFCGAKVSELRSMCSE